MKNKILNVKLIMGLTLTVLFFSCAKDEMITPTNKEKQNNQALKSSYNSASSIETINVNIVNQTTQVNNALTSKTPFTIEDVFLRNQALIQGTPSTKTKQINLTVFKFGSNEQKDTRRPQGVANFGQYIINSWYFTEESTDWEDNCKLTVTDLTRKKYFNLVPVTFHSTQTNKFKHIDSHAGGLTVIGHYLYIASGNVIQIFDLDKIYPVTSEPDSTVANDQKFIYEYDYMIPQVGRMDFITLSGARASYMSLAEINYQKYFLLGNFYSREDYNPFNPFDLVYMYGGKSMIWLLKIEEGVYPFATIKVNGQTPEFYQINPLFPSGDEKNKTITRIQGAIIKDNVLILNRSWQDETYHLIAMEYVDILFSNTLIKYFSGTTSNKLGYNNKNWLYGCEDLEYYNGKIWNVTEFGDRCIYYGNFQDIINLMAPVI